MNYKPLSKREESIAEKIVDAAYTVHKILGPGLLEKVYEVCFCHELSKRGLQYKRQVDITIIERSNYEARAYRNHLSKIF
jgi:GxxExxY protein